MRQLLFVFLFCMGSFLSAEVVEVKHFHEIEEYITSDTLVILDIDNTLLMSSQELGSDQWFRYRIESYKEEGKSRSEALGLALAEWEAIQNITEVEVVEPTTPGIIEELQCNQIDVIGFSSRSLALATSTIRQLQSVGINLSATAPSKEEILLVNERPILFREGILFAFGTHKGKGLQKLFAELGYRPARVVFINDKSTHLRQLGEGVEELGIPFIGLRYGYLDEKVSNFRPDIADVQFACFRKILSDQEAENLLHAKR